MKFWNCLSTSTVNTNKKPMYRFERNSHLANNIFSPGQWLERTKVDMDLIGKTISFLYLSVLIKENVYVSLCFLLL